jgi:hypothetical protein
MLFTFHAKDRFAERFPDCPLSLEQAFDQSIPFGAETKSTINRIHPHYKIVFVVDKNNGDYYVKTVLTEDLYYGNIQMLAGRHSCHTSSVYRPQPTEAELLAHRKQLRDEERRDEIKQIRIANQQYDQSIRKLAQSFAKEKNYITWQPEFYDEVKNRFGLSKKKTVAVFLPVYVSEVSHFQLFQ